MSAITTHVLDTARGVPAAGVPVVLERRAGQGEWYAVGRGETDADGRMRSLMTDGAAIVPGYYRLIFDTRRYFTSIGVKGFYPQVVVIFETVAGEKHYHVPLLLGPFHADHVPRLVELSSKGALKPGDLKPILTALRRANAVVAAAYPGETGDRQPIHTVYGGAHLFRSDSAAKLGALAVAALDEYAPDGATLARALEWRSADLPFAETVRSRVMDKLRREPVEDFRLDFEDGYGNRPDTEEDGHAQSAAEEVAAGSRAGTLPAFIGIRIKPMSNELNARSLRTLDLFVSTLVRALRSRLPENFVVTIPKVMARGQVLAVARACAALEKRLALKPRAIRFELMIETPQSILAADGRSALRDLVLAGGGRVVGAHFGTYDYTALCGITASWQHMRHQVCDFAKHMMQIALAQTGVRLSDGATNIMPVGPHRAAADRPLSEAQRRENRDVVHRAWKVHYDDIQHSLVNGYYQGWDLHPAQLVTRYAAVYAFFLSARPAATARLKNFIEKAAQATLVGDVFDDAATGQGLLNFFVRGLTSGALTIEEATETGLTFEELQGRSFLRIVEGRRGR